MTAEDMKFRIGFYEVLRTNLNQVHCPKGCEQKKIIVQLKEQGQELFVYCNSCGTIIFDSKMETERLLKDVKI